MTRQQEKKWKYATTILVRYYSAITTSIPIFWMKCLLVWFIFKYSYDIVKSFNCLLYRSKL